MPAIRPHTKSRTGCSHCKHRKVKCDEGLPECFNCRRHGVACSLAATKHKDHSSKTICPPKHDKLLPMQPRLVPASLSWMQTPELLPRTPQPQSQCPSEAPEASSHIGPLSLGDIASYTFELIHHYSTVMSDTLSTRADIRYVWSVVVPREGYKHAYVRHGTLALAAAHKAYLCPSRRDTYVALADHHQTVGSEGFRCALGHMADEANWSPLFGFSSLVVSYLMTLPIRSAGMQIDEPIERFLELFVLVRAIRTALTPLIPRVLRSEFAPLVYGVFPGEESGPSPGNPSLDHSPLPGDTFDALTALHAFQTRDLPAASHAAYAASHAELINTTRRLAVAGAHYEAGAVMVWPYSIQDSLMADVAARRPHGLLALAYFSVFWAVLEKPYWYTRGWTHQILAEVETHLADLPVFLHLLAWPKRAVEVLRGGLL